MLVQDGYNGLAPGTGCRDEQDGSHDFLTPADHLPNILEEELGAGPIWDKRTCTLLKVGAGPIWDKRTCTLL